MQQKQETKKYKLNGGKNTPKQSFKAGPIRATVWENSHDGEIKFNTISLDRSYKDKAGNWQKTSTLRLNDIPKAEIVLKKAYEYLVLSSTEAVAEN